MIFIMVYVYGIKPYENKPFKYHDWPAFFSKSKPWSSNKAQFGTLK